MYFFIFIIPFECVIFLWAYSRHIDWLYRTSVCVLLQNSIKKTKSHTYNSLSCQFTCFVRSITYCSLPKMIAIHGTLIRNCYCNSWHSFVDFNIFISILLPLKHINRVSHKYSTPLNTHIHNLDIMIWLGKKTSIELTRND